MLHPVIPFLVAFFLLNFKLTRLFFSASFFLLIFYVAFSAEVFPSFHHQLGLEKVEFFLKVLSPLSFFFFFWSFPPFSSGGGTGCPNFD